MHCTHHFHLSFVNSFLICIHHSAAFSHQYVYMYIYVMLDSLSLEGSQCPLPVCSKRKEMTGCNICKSTNSATHYDLENRKLYDVNDFKNVLFDS